MSNKNVFILILIALLAGACADEALEAETQIGAEASSSANTDPIGASSDANPLYPRDGVPRWIAQIDGLGNEAGHITLTFESPVGKDDLQTHHQPLRNLDYSEINGHITHGVLTLWTDDSPEWVDVRLRIDANGDLILTEPVLLWTPAPTGLDVWLMLAGEDSAGNQAILAAGYARTHITPGFAYDGDDLQVQVNIYAVLIEGVTAE